MDRLLITPLKITSAIGLSVSTALMILGETLDVPGLIYAFSALTGLFSGIMAQQWIIAYRRISLRDLICSFPMLITVAIGTCVTVMYLPSPFITGTAIALPCASGIALHSVRRYLFPLTDDVIDPKNRPLHFMIALLPIIVFYLSTGFFDFFSVASPYTFFFYAAIAVIPLAIAAGFILLQNRASIMSCLVIPSLVLTAILTPMFWSSALLPASNFIAVGELGTEIVLFLLTVGLASYFELSALKIYGLARAVAVVFTTVGWYMAAFFNDHFDNLINSQASYALIFIGIEMLAVLLIVSTVAARRRLDATDPAPLSIPTGNVAQQVVANKRERRELSELEHEQDATKATDDEATANTHGFEHRISTLSDQYGLSARERDVLRLLARGYSAARIQNELYISSGTVNFHSHNIYTKLGVHSKQEIIALIFDQDTQTP